MAGQKACGSDDDHRDSEVAQGTEAAAGGEARGEPASGSVLGLSVFSVCCVKKETKRDPFSYW